MNRGQAVAIKKTKSDKVKYKAFSKRLDTAVDNHPDSPNGHGRQKWLRDTLQEKFNHSVTPEGTRRWFAGEVRPRPDVMKLIAAALEVDEAWLSLGLTPSRTVRDQKVHDSTVSGAVNYVAGLIQLSGGQVAFPDDADEDGADFLAIVKGRRYNVKVAVPNTSFQDAALIHVPADYRDLFLICVMPTSNPMLYSLVRVSEEVIQKSGNDRGGYLELRLGTSDESVVVDGVQLFPIIRLDDLAAETSTTDGSKEAARARTRRALDL